MNNEPTCKKERAAFMITHFGTPIYRLRNPDGTFLQGETSCEYAVYPTRDEAEKKVAQMKVSFPSFADSYKILPIYVRVFDEHGRDRPGYEDGWNDVITRMVPAEEVV